MSIRFNGGNGALTCDFCCKILATGGPNPDKTWQHWFVAHYVYDVEHDKHFCTGVCQFKWKRVEGLVK